eukprot:113399-Prymnesium_polylepis.1
MHALTPVSRSRQVLPPGDPPQGPIRPIWALGPPWAAVTAAHPPKRRVLLAEALELPSERARAG